MSFSMFLWAQSNHGGHSWLSFLCTWSWVWSLGQVAQGNSTPFMRSAWLPLTLLGRLQGPAQPQWLVSPVCLVLTEGCSQLDEPTSQSHPGCPRHTDWPSHTRDRRLPPRARGQLLSLCNREEGCLFQPHGGRWALAGSLSRYLSAQGPAGAHSLDHSKRETKILQKTQLKRGLRKQAKVYLQQPRHSHPKCIHNLING